MEKADIEHLARLARIRLTDKEIEELKADLSSIVAYVGAVSEIAGDDVDTKPELGARYNIFRQDEITNQPEEFTKDALAEMPKTHGRFLEVKKILKTDT